ncbi:MAG: HAD family hydrolase [Patescibacteria group bacterium]
MAKLQKKSGNTKFFGNIRAIGFDFDDTLIDGQYSIRQRWQKVLRDYSFLSPNLEKRFFEIYNKKGPNYKFHLDDTLAELKIGKEFKEEILLELRKTFQDEKLLNGAKDLLESIKKTVFKMGIITDGKRSYQEGRIKKAGIYDYFDFVIYGKGKKDKKPTKKILESLNKYLNKISVKFPEEFLYIGDNFKNDVEGFLNMGAKVCWITNNKENLVKDNLIIVKSLKELEKKLTA